MRAVDGNKTSVPRTEKERFMKKCLLFGVLCTAVLAAGEWAVIGAESQPNAPMFREDALLVSITASVQSIDRTNREVTLKGPLGNEVTFTVDKQVKRFEEISVGDLVEADYYVSLAAEVRKPTAEEKKNPFVLLDVGGKAPPGTAPAAGGLRRFRVVTTIEGLDRPTRTVTVKGPRGNYLTARVIDPDRLTKVRIGDNVVVTYTEALAISLAKAQKKAPEQ